MVETSKNIRKPLSSAEDCLVLKQRRGSLHLGMDVSVVHLSPYIMERQLDETAPKMPQPGIGSPRHEVPA